MKKQLLACISLAVLIASPVMAADLLVHPTVVAAPYSWTGVYIGVNGGYGRSNSEVDVSSTVTSCLTFPPCPAANSALGRASVAAIPPVFATNPKGGIAGGQIGFNYQAGAWLVGLEADLAWSGMKGTNAQTGLAFVGPPLPTATISAAAAADQRLNDFGTIRGRLGFLPVNPLLVYVTGGLAFAEMKSNTTVAEACNPTLATCGGSFLPVIVSISRARIGATVGGGLEYAFAPGWSLRGEYLYFNLGSTYSLAPLNLMSTAAAPSAALVTAVVQSSTTEFSGSIVRAGLNYKFYSPGVIP